MHFYTKSAKAQRICLCPNLVAGLVRPQWGSWERERADWGVWEIIPGAM